MQKKGTDNAEYRTAGYLHPHHRKNRRFPGGGRPSWIRPWSGENAAGRITRPLRHNGMPYSGINILMLWASSVEQGFGSSSWMTFKQALELNANVRKGEKGSLVVYANSVTKTEQNGAGEDVEREIHFLK